MMMPILALLLLALLSGCNSSDVTRCEGDVAVHSGEKLWYEDCAEQGKHCVDPGPEPFCVDSTEPDPECDHGTFCDGYVLVVCRSGYLQWRDDCAPGKCVQNNPSDTRCVPKPPEPDPRCSTDGYVCAGDWALQCKDGFSQWERTCPQCFVDPTGTLVALDGTPCQ